MTNHINDHDVDPDTPAPEDVGDGGQLGYFCNPPAQTGGDRAVGRLMEGHEQDPPLDKIARAARSIP